MKRRCATRLTGASIELFTEMRRRRKSPTLDPADSAKLVTALRHENQLWRLHAQRLLVERQKTDVVPALIELLGDTLADAIGLNPGAIHALWTLHGLGAIANVETPAAHAVLAALKHPSAGVRRNAAQVLPADRRSASAVLAAGLLHDPDPQVRLAALLSLADLPPSEEVATALAVVLRGGLARGDQWLADGATAAAAKNSDAFLKTLAKKDQQAAGTDVLVIAGRVAEHWARGAPSESAGALGRAFRGRSRGG